jgi:hypothetical protein
MPKQKTIRKLVDDCAVLLQKIRRLESADDDGYCTCVTCGKNLHWKQMDGGHWISRTYTIHKLNPDNIHPQCKGCNRFDHKIHDDYTLWMIDNYGMEFVEDMNMRKHEPKKYSRPEIEEIKQELKQRMKEFEHLM